MSECKVGSGWDNGDGRPRHNVDGIQQYEYRSAWVTAKGPIPDGMCVHHACGNPSCINTDHLELMTKRQHTSLHAKGERGICSTITEEQAINIMARLLTGKEIKNAIARDVGCSYSVVANIWCGNSWSHLFKEVCHD